MSDKTCPECGGSKRVDDLVERIPGEPELRHIGATKPCPDCTGEVCATCEGSGEVLIWVATDAKPCPDCGGGE